MRYHWLAHHLVRERFPRLEESVRDRVVSEAVCRAWCTFLAPDYRLMRACVDAAAKRMGLVPPQEAASGCLTSAEPNFPRAGQPRGAAVLRMSDFRQAP